jgi:hypothetical protein
VRIRIENGKCETEFTASELKGLVAAHRVCVELGRWLDDDDAMAAATSLDVIVGRYTAIETEVVELPTKEEEGSDE